MGIRGRVLAAAGATIALAVSIGAVSTVVAAAVRHPPPRAEADAHLVPVDVAWLVVASCLHGVRLPGGVGFGQDGDRIHLRVEELDDTMSADELAVVALVDDCLSAYAIEGEFSAGNPRWSMSAARRLVLFDHARHWMLPCLRARGLDAPQARLADYLDFDKAPWLAMYDSTAELPLVEALAARRACGSGTGVIAARSPD